MTSSSFSPSPAPDGRSAGGASAARAGDRAARSIDTEALRRSDAGPATPGRAAVPQADGTP